MKTKSFIPIVLTSALLLSAGDQARAQSTYAFFEARHVHPIGLTPDGTKLLALNSPDGRLSIFDVSNAMNPAPVLIGEVPAGVEPVSLRARTNDEVWVVNEVGDTVSVISIARGAVIGSLRAPDEPADVAFAAGKAFVSCARSNEIRVFEATTRQALGVIPLVGNYPRALAVSADGTRLYAAFQLSGNRTSILSASQAPPPPAPTNTALPAAPQTALIVPASDSRINYTVLDNDVAEIDTSTHAVIRYLSDTGTNLFDIALHPVTGELWVANTDAMNLTRFEPALKGRFADHRLSKVALPGTTVSVFDLNPGINYAVLPNPPAQAVALAQPTAIVFAADGTHGWVAAFNSDRVAKFTPAGAIVARADVRPATASGAREMRGPRGLALGADGARLYVLNKLFNSISVVDTASGNVMAEIPVGSSDPMPQQVKEGRGFLFDARLSGNGVSSCAVCHLDADRDGLAWDLGDPGGSMVTVTGFNNSIHDTTPQNRVMHPMKGPMTTQTLRGLQPGQIFHWRGDRPTVQSFDVTFRDLMGGSLPSAADMDAMAAYLGTVRLHPNPNRGLNRSMPSSFEGGNPNTGRLIFLDHVKSHCVTCHALPTGSDNNIDLMAEIGSSQPVKTPHLRTVYQRRGFSRAAGAVNVSGFGLLKDGAGFAMPIVHPYVLDELSTLQEFKDVSAYVLCFDTGVAPVVGHSITVTTADLANAAVLADLTTMEAQAATQVSGVPNANLVARGSIGGRVRSFLYQTASSTYASDDASEGAITRSGLLASLAPGDVITFTGMPAGDGARASTDRDSNGIFNAQEATPFLQGLIVPGAVRLQWPASAGGWLLETSATLQPPWLPVTAPRGVSSGLQHVDENPAPAASGFYRLRRVW